MSAFGQQAGLLARICPLLLVVACETNPRVKAWRHDGVEDDVAIEAVAAGDQASATAIRARRSHTLRVHVDTEVKQLNPMVSPSIWTRRISLGPVFETLIRYAPPGPELGPGRYVPGVAKSWRVYGDGTELFLELEPGTKFHDGRALTSVDVQFSLDVARDPRRGVDHLRALLSDVETVELVTARSVRIRLRRGNGWVMRALAEVPILPAHVYGGSLTAGGQIIGSGPWQLASWQNGVVHLTRFGGYWGPSPAIDDLEFVFVADVATALTNAKQGQLDLLPTLVASQWPAQAQAPGIAASFAPITFALPRFRYLAFDCSAPPTDDARVRQAISVLLDRTAMAKASYFGWGRPLVSPVWPGGPVDGAMAAVTEPDLPLAGRLLDEAGWIDLNGDGTRERGGVPLRLDVLLVDRSGDGKLHPEQEQLLMPLKRAGILAQHRFGSEAVIWNRLKAKDFDLALAEWAGAVDFDLAPLLAQGGGKNAGGCGSPEIDGALAEQRAALDPASRVRASAALAAALGQAWPIAVVSSPEPHGLIHRRVVGAVPWDGWLDLRALRFAEDPR